jgi:hypothetical protein
MTIADILRHRIYNQGLVQTEFENPAQVVRKLGAVQAQDYHGSLWAIGQRIKKCSEHDVERAIAEKEIVRTWPMRGTLHYVTTEDVRWMLKLLTPRVIARTASIYKTAELDTATFKKSGKIIERVLRDGKLLTRDEMYEALADGKVSPEGLRGLHILGYLAQEGLICQGPRRGKQPTFTLLEEWLPPIEPISRDEAVSRLTLNYFAGHGPATVRDFSWWSGLTITESQRGIDMVKSELAFENVNDEIYWFSQKNPVPKKMPESAFLLPAYDEYTVAYKDRSFLVAESPKTSSMKGRMNVIFNNTILINGKVVGTWRRTLSKTQINLEVNPLIPLNKVHLRAIETVAAKYGKFLGMSVVITGVKKSKTDKK